MTINKDLKYVIIDDDSFNNMLCSLVIEDALGEADTKTFTKPEDGLDYLEQNAEGPTVLFLDINMPKLTGWQFLERYDQFSERVKKQVEIYMLSSSLDHRDRDRARANKYVKGFLSKPLEFDTVVSIANGDFHA